MIQNARQTPFYQAVLDTAVDPIIVIDRHGLITDANAACCQLFGYLRDELIGTSINRLMPADIAAQHDHYLQRHLQDGTNHIIGQLRMVTAKTRDGENVPCMLSVSRVVTDDGIFFTGILRSQARLQAAENKLHRALDFMRQINEWTRHPLDTDHLQRALNHLQRFAGFHRATLTLADTTAFAAGCLHSPAFTADPLPVDPLAERVMKSGRPVEAVVNGEPYLGLPLTAANHCVGALGGYFAPGATTTRLEHDHGELLQLALNTVAAAIANQRTRDELATHLERLRRSHHCARIGTWDWDIPSGDLFWTETIAPLFGYAPGELDTSYSNFINAVHPDDRQRVQDAVNAAVEHNAPYDIDHRVVWPDGTVRWVNEKGAVQRDAQGKAIKMLGVVQDIQRTKEFEMELMISRQAAESANRAKSEFLSSMSHELRTPLNSILGFSQLLLADPLNDDQRESVDLIYRAGQHLLQLVNDVLDLAKLDSGLIQTRIEEVELRPLLTQCLNLLATPIKAKQIKITEYIKPGHHWVRADALRLKQVLLNLLSNAVKYNRQNGHISIGCTGAGPGRIRICVRDTGYGIPASRRADLFKPFSRLGFANSAVEGAGIGLLISQRLAQAMEGELGFDSEENKGSEFWIELNAAQRRPQNSITLIEAGDNAITHQPFLKGLRILCIEDNTINRYVLNRMITQHLHGTFFEASTLQEGLTLADTCQPDLVLLDIQLPDGNGIQGCQILRQRFGNGLPIIAVTADAINKVPLGPALFNDVEYKPVDMFSMLDKIRRHAARRNCPASQ